MAKNVEFSVLLLDGEAKGLLASIRTQSNEFRLSPREYLEKIWFPSQQNKIGGYAASILLSILSRLLQEAEVMEWQEVEIAE